MDYHRIYSALVSRDHTGEYLEQHHIVPRCLGGGDDPSNLVLLTARAHFIAHWLLRKMYPDNVKVAQAFAVMRYGTKFHKRIFTSHGFSAAKKAHSMETAHRMRTLNPMHRPDVAQKVATAKTGTHLSDAVKQKVSQAKRGVRTGARNESFKQLVRGVEYHDPSCMKTVRFRLHLGEVPPDNWLKGRALRQKSMWATNGVANIKIETGSALPIGYVHGRTLHRGADGKVQKCPQ